MSNTITDIASRFPWPPQDRDTAYRERQRLSSGHTSDGFVMRADALDAQAEEGSHYCPTLDHSPEEMEEWGWGAWGAEFDTIAVERCDD